MAGIYKKAIGCLMLAALLGGCIPTAQQARRNQDLEEMKRRLALLERRVTSQNLDMADEAGKGLTALTKRQADMEADMDSLRVEIQTFQGRLDEAVRRNEQLQEELNLVRDEIVLKTADREDRLSTTTGDKPKLAVAVTSSEPAEKKPEELYKEGLILIRDKGKYAEGRRIFQNFLKEHPDHRLAVNATYWIGEAYYGDKEYENAILQFQDVVEKYSTHAKAASAMYKQAFAFHALGDDKNAGVVLEKLIQVFPASSEAGRAKKKLSEWQK